MTIRNDKGQGGDSSGERRVGVRGWRRAEGWTGGGWMDTQKGAHGCATTTPVVQTPQLPVTAPARPEVTRLLPTMPLPFSNATCLPSAFTLSPSVSVSLFVFLPSPFIRHSFDLLLRPPLFYAIVSRPVRSLSAFSSFHAHPPRPRFAHPPLSFTCVHAVRARNRLDRDSLAGPFLKL